MLIQYARDNRGRRVGVFVADSFDGNIRTGWSKCRKETKVQPKFEPYYQIMVGHGNEIQQDSTTHRGDIFSEKFGLDVARGRMNLGSEMPLPHSLRVKFEKFVDRAKRYYKGAT